MPKHKRINVQIYHRRESLAWQIYAVGIEFPIRGVEADRDGEQRVQEVHHSILVESQEG